MVIVTVSNCKSGERVIFHDIKNKKNLFDNWAGLDGEISCFIPDLESPEIKIIFGDRRPKKGL